MESSSAAAPIDASHPASFRDPAGFIFRRDGVLYRHVAEPGRAAYRALMDSGLYADLVAAGLLIPHEELSSVAGDSAGITLRPETVSTISYPYEWSFGQLKDAALATLEIQRCALDKGQWLKDSSAYNIQFHAGRPVLIDTLSFEAYREGSPWPAYKQFCQHFLGPLALMAYVDVRLSQLLRVHIDGIPLDLTSQLLPGKTRFKPGLLAHIHLHASAQQRFADESKATKGKAGSGSAAKITKIGLLGIIDGLRSAVAGLEYTPQGTVWGDYYDNTNYTDAAMASKHQLVAEFLDAIDPKPATAWDLGANNGAFSRLAAERGMQTVAWDIDPAAVEQNWRAVKARADTRMLPLVQDLTNPSPGLGWAGTERDSFVQRGPADVVLALALIHHLAIGNNVPLARIADLFADVCADTLIVEWVPAEDSQSQRLLAQHDGPLGSYRIENFVVAFERRFTVVAAVAVEGTQRRLYRMRKRPMPTTDEPAGREASPESPGEPPSAAGSESHRRFLWLHPLCFALFPVLSLYAANLDQVPYPDAVRPLVASLLFAAALAAVIFLVLHDARRTALLLTLWLFLLFSYGHATDFAEQAAFRGPTVQNAIGDLSLPTGTRIVLFALWCALFVAAALAARRTPRDLLRPLTEVLNFVGVILVALPVYAITSQALEDHGLIGPPRNHSVVKDPIATLLSHTRPDPRDAPTPAEPDIYYIILDAYGREDVLQHYYDFNNHPFVEALRRRGFYVADRARPNYGQTVESISSSLNMMYLDKVKQVVGRPDSYAPLTAIIDRNAVAAALRPRGYQFVAVTTGFDLTAPATADMLLGDEHVDKARALTPFDVLALDTTPFTNLPTKERTLYDGHRDQLLQGFHDLGEIPRLPFRKFVFAHILAPHPPFVFGPNGEPIRPPRRPYSIADASDFFRHGTRPEYKSNYIGQLQYVNTLVLRAIDAIYAGSKVRPIVIVQGDHGPRMFVDWDSLERTDVRETYGNLNAFELPDGSAPHVFYDTITPVNSFRLLLDHYFGMGYARLPDRNYYATLDEPYKFVDVTGKVGGH